MQTTVRITTAAHGVLKGLARLEKIPMQKLLERAIEEYRRQRFLETVNRAYADVRRDKGAWAELEAEREAWDATLGDGLEGETRTTKRRRTRQKSTRR
jgi:hypothetical protein